MFPYFHAVVDVELTQGLQMGEPIMLGRLRIEIGIQGRVPLH